MGSKLRRIRYRLKHDFLAVENIVLVVAVAMCLTWTYQSIVAMTRNWELAERLNAEKRNLQLLEIEVETAELENDYYRTDEYQELAARKMADKKLAGENMVYLPKNSEAAKNKHKSTQEIAQEEDEEYSNFEKWMRFLFPNR